MASSVCSRCGNATHPSYERVCSACGAELSPSGSIPTVDHQWHPISLDEPLSGAVLIREYPGRTAHDATVRFREEAQILAARRYFPTSQSWAAGRPGIARWLLLGLAAGTLSPDGTLTVVYRLEGEGPVDPAS